MTSIIHDGGGNRLGWMCVPHPASVRYSLMNHGIYGVMFGFIMLNL